jgi:hypothetical protein
LIEQHVKDDVEFVELLLRGADAMLSGGVKTGKMIRPTTSRRQLDLKCPQPQPRCTGEESDRHVSSRGGI